MAEDVGTSAGVSGADGQQPPSAGLGRPKADAEVVSRAWERRPEIKPSGSRYQFGAALQTSTTVGPLYLHPQGFYTDPRLIGPGPPG